MSSFTVTSEPEGVATKSPAAGSLSTPTHQGSSSSKLQINAAPWTPNSNTNSPSAAAASNSHNHHHHGGMTAVPQRQALCPNFMAHGSCLDSRCTYAHAVDELDANGQMNLMTMMSGGAGSPAGGWGGNGGVHVGGGSGSWGHHNTRGYGRHHQNPNSSHNVSLQDDGLDDIGSGPSMRRVPGQPRTGGGGTRSHNTSGSSLGGSGPINTQNGVPSSSGQQQQQQQQCPPSPGSHSGSEDLSSVSNTSGGDGLTASSQQSGSANTQHLLHGMPPSALLGNNGYGGGHPHHLQHQQQQQSGSGAPGSYGPHTSPFIKSQMYYSQSANKISLPERCRYPHVTPGTYYDYLNVKTTVTREDIEHKYQQWRDDGYKKAMQIDQDKADAMDRLIVDAKNVLCSERMRSEYDAMIPRQGVVAQPFRDPAVHPTPSSGGGHCPSKAGAIGRSDNTSSPPPAGLSLGNIYSEGGLW